MVKFICEHCGSSDVSADAAAYWDTFIQRWVVSQIFDDGHSCNTCGKETDLIEVTIDER